VGAKKSAHHLCLHKDRSANLHASCLPVEKKLFGLSGILLGGDFPFNDETTIYCDTI
jgi:hypothetical protein